MKSIEEMKLRLEMILTPKRFIHSINVMNTAVDLATKCGVEKEKAAIAGLLHDCARDIKMEEIFYKCEQYGIAVDCISRLQPELLHGPIGLHIARADYGVEDKSILEAIYYHTTGHEGMDILEKIIFLADFIEPGRNFTGVNEVRDLAISSFESAVLMSLDSTIKHVMSKGLLVHPNTLNARNHIIFSRTN